MHCFALAIILIQIGSIFTQDPCIQKMAKCPQPSQPHGSDVNCQEMKGTADCYAQLLSDSDCQNMKQQMEPMVAMYTQQCGGSGGGGVNCNTQEMASKVTNCGIAQKVPEKADDKKKMCDGLDKALDCAESAAKKTGCGEMFVQTKDVQMKIKEEHCSGAILTSAISNLTIVFALFFASKHLW